MKAIYSDLRSDAAVNAAQRRVDSVMSSPVRSIQASTLLGEALTVMARAGLRHLAVVDVGGQFLGVLSDRTIAAAWAIDPSCLSWTHAGMVVDTGHATVRPGANVLTAARAMRSAETDAVAVVDDSGAVVGIVTGSDMIAALAR